MDDILTTEFISAIIGGITSSIALRKLLAFPPKMGGRGIPIFNEISDLDYENSKLPIETLCNKIKQQDRR